VTTEPVVSPPPAEVIPIGRGLKGTFVANLGMAMFLFSWGLSFVGIGVAYLIVWSRMAVWPPPETPPRPALSPIINTVIVLASSVTYHLATRSAEQNKPVAVRRWMLITGVLAVVFMAMQALMWAGLYAAGFRLGLNVYVGMFYALTGFHALHVLAGLGTLAVLAPRAIRGEFNARDYTSLRLTGWFWHFVTVAWVAIYILLWLI
jgi:cytochrome c oxidase subunit 3